MPLLFGLVLALGLAACSDAVVDLGGTAKQSKADSAAPDSGEGDDGGGAEHDAGKSSMDAATPLDAGELDAASDASRDSGAPLDAGSDATIPDPIVTGSVVSVAAGDQTSCAILSDKRVACWGRNDSAQLALPPRSHATCVDCEPRPVEVPALHGATQLALGHSHGCALLNGDVVCWGRNAFGELGLGKSDLLLHETPAKVAIANVVELAAGNGFTCARNSTNQLFCWGLGQRGELTVDPTTLGGCAAPPDLIASAGLEGRATSVACSKTPLQASVPSAVKKIAAGAYHGCAIDSSDALYCWGSNLRGELGLNKQSVTEPPTMVLSNVSDMALGTSHSCAISGGAVSCWGQGVFGQLGNGANTFTVTTPTAAPSAGNALSLAAGDAHTCAIDDTHVVRCTGANDWDQLGVAGPDSCSISGLTTECARNFTVTGLPTNISKLALGNAHGCLVSDGKALCWGDNTYGELGVIGKSRSLSALEALAP
ncbi:MAG TPA: hypothetical protein VHM19_07330 [Polyangiales bacterium]|nr:hypothetical protein [Polyangiales bacterium]